MREDHVLALIAVFVPFSLISIGGGIGVISGIENEIVNVRGWISSQDFIELFAISRAAPGPGTMIATLIGWQVAGWPGAVAATLAFFGPSSLLCYMVFHLSNLHRERPWHRAMREGLAPVGTGLVISSVLAIFRLSGNSPFTAVLAVAAAIVLIWLPRIPIYFILAAGAAVALVVR